MLKESLITQLTSMGCGTNSTGVEYIVSCPFNNCGKSSNHPHLYIHIDMDNDDPLFFNCKKCNESGILDSDLLNVLGLSLSVDMEEELKRYTKKTKYNTKNNSSIETFHPIIHSHSIVCDRKLEYLNNRMGCSVDYKTAVEYKIILDIHEFLAENQITTTGAKPKMLDIVQRDYIGFLSNNNNTVICRYVGNDPKKLVYYKFKLNIENFNNSNFYSVLPPSISLLYTEPVDIHISEGIFDILGVIFNTDNIVDSRMSFKIAMCGFGYRSILRNLIHSGLVSGLNVHVYADNDKDDSEQMKQLSQFYPWFDKLTLHRNRYPNKKDYGVQRHEILDKSKNVKRG